MYNHDFKSILNSTLKCLELGKLTEAKDILYNLDHNITHIINENKSYSNNLIVDIILNELSEKCSNYKIQFSAECYIPPNFKLNDLELSRIFSNLSNNAYEACLKLNDINSMNLQFKSYTKDDFFIIFTQNTFNGFIIEKNNKFITTKTDSIHHGVGIESIKQIVNSVDGIILIKYITNSDTNIFKFLIKIPLY